jgi:nucleoside-diphosphate-sugar epimerase
LQLILTGASGYIGQRLIELAIQRGIRVVALGSPPANASAAHVLPWRLGEEPEREVFEGAMAVIHLAHSWASDASVGDSLININLVGSEKLARAALANDVPRFLFASTLAAYPDAANSYGRVKSATERRLLALSGAQGRVICARIGLVYGGREDGQYGLMTKLVRATPILPIVGIDRIAQPIHVDEVCAALLALAIDPLPRRSGIASAVWVVAGPESVTVGKWLHILRFAHTGKRIALVPIPLSVALFGCYLSRIVPFVPTIDRERILGLAGKSVYESSADLALLKVGVIAPEKRLASLRSARRRRIAEAIAMLSYVAGRRISSPKPVARLLCGISRSSDQALGFPWYVFACPLLLRAFEPLRSRADHRLAQRLHLAAMVLETMPAAQIPDRHRRLTSVALQITLEAISLPFRLMLGSRFA